MVKGISKRVVVVKAPASSMFEQAIFILSDGQASSCSVNSENILREACSVADDYVREHCGEKRSLLIRKPIMIAASLCAFLILSFLFSRLF